MSQKLETQLLCNPMFDTSMYQTEIEGCIDQYSLGMPHRKKLQSAVNLSLYERDIIPRYEEMAKTYGSSIKDTLDAYNVYSAFLWNFTRERNVKAQNKIMASVLEEVSMIALLPHAARRGLRCGPYKCTVDIIERVLPSGVIEYVEEKKDVDVAVVVVAKIKTPDNKFLRLKIPLVGVEVKRYLDSTMAATVIQPSRAIRDFTAEIANYFAVLEVDALDADSLHVTNFYLRGRTYCLRCQKRTKKNGEPEKIGDPVQLSVFEKFIHDAVSIMDRKIIEVFPCRADGSRYPVQVI